MEILLLLLDVGQYLRLLLEVGSHEQLLALVLLLLLDSSHLLLENAHCSLIMRLVLLLESLSPEFWLAQPTLLLLLLLIDITDGVWLMIKIWCSCSISFRMTNLIFAAIDVGLRLLFKRAACHNSFIIVFKF